MVGDRWKYVWGFLLLLIWQGAFAQGHLFSDVKLNQSSVYVGQPVELTVLVYTSTWFTRGIDPGNIKVNGAFTVYFRSVSSTKQSSGKQSDYRFRGSIQHSANHGRTSME